MLPVFCCGTDELSKFSNTFILLLHFRSGCGTIEKMGMLSLNYNEEELK